MTGMMFAGTGSGCMNGVAAGMCMAGALGQNNSYGRSGFFDGANINATLVGWAGKLEAEKAATEAAEKTAMEAAKMADKAEAVEAAEEADNVEAVDAAMTEAETAPSETDDPSETEDDTET